MVGGRLLRSGALLLSCVWANVASARSSVYTNPDSDDIGLTEHGSNFLWAIFALMLLSDLTFIAWHFRQPRGERMFFQMPIIILTTASIAYLGLASNLGNTPTYVEFRGNNITRAIWYVRYIDWVITTPMLLLELLMGTGMSISDLLTVLFFDVAMIVVGLVGALVASSYKWGFYTLGMCFEFYIWYVLLGPARNTAALHGPEVKRAYTNSAIYLSALWLLYPVCWGLADGGNIITVTGEMVFYGVLDFLAKPVFCFFHVSALRKVPYEQLQYVSVDSRVGGAIGQTVGGKGHSHLTPYEKQRDAAATEGVTTSGVATGNNAGYDGTTTHGSNTSGTYTGTHNGATDGYSSGVGAGPGTGTGITHPTHNQNTHATVPSTV